jgi:hypothetical protein
MIDKTTLPAASADDFNLDALLWTPGQEPTPVASPTAPAQADGEAPSEGAPAAVTTPTASEKFQEVAWEKDAKKVKVSAGEMLNSITKVMQELSHIPKDVNNALSKTESDEIIKACEFAEQRGFSSFVGLGQLVLAVEGESNEEMADAMKNPFTTQMGDIWDRTNYDYLQHESLPTINEKLRLAVEDAFLGLETIEDQWQDKKDEATLLANREAVVVWIKTHVLGLTKAAKEVVMLTNAKRTVEEEKIERPKYPSLGAALKAQDIPEFEKMLKKAAFDPETKDGAETLNKLAEYALKQSIVAALPALYEAKADLKQTDEQGRNYHFQAVAAGNVELAKVLETFGLSVAEKDLNGVTPLVAAIRSQSIEMVEHLIYDLKMDANNNEYGINAECWKGSTPLVYAASDENLPMVELLLKEGANPTHTVWFDQDASILDYTETPEIEAILEAAIQAWPQKNKKPKP